MEDSLLLVLSLCAAAFGAAVQPNAIGTHPWIKERAFGRESPGKAQPPTLGEISTGPGHPGASSRLWLIRVDSWFLERPWIIWVTYATARITPCSSVWWPAWSPTFPCCSMAAWKYSYETERGTLDEFMHHLGCSKNHTKPMWIYQIKILSTVPAGFPGFLFMSIDVSAVPLADVVACGFGSTVRSRDLGSTLRSREFAKDSDLSRRTRWRSLGIGCLLSDLGRGPQVPLRLFSETVEPTCNLRLMRRMHSSRWNRRSYATMPSPRCCWSVARL